MLDDLINQIEQRHQKDLLLLPFLDIGRIEAAKLSQGVLSFYDARQMMKIDKEIFMFKHYLLALREIEASDGVSDEKINAAISKVTHFLESLYHAYPGGSQQLDLRSELLKEHLVKAANYSLIDGAQDNDIALVEAALKAGANANFKYLDDRALRLAAQHNNVNMVEMLINHGAQINDSNERESTPLIAAIHANNLSLVKLLIEKGADANFEAMGKWGRYSTTALAEAFGNPHVSTEIIDYLLNLPGIKLNQRFYTRLKSVLHIALDTMKHHGQVDKVLALLKAPCFIKTVEDFKQAIHMGLDCVQILVDARYDCSAEVIAEAIERKDSSIIDLLIKQPSADLEGAKALLKRDYNYTDLMFYVAIGDEESIRRVVAETNLEEENVKKETALKLASHLGRAEIVRLLLQQSATINNAPEQEEDTALHIAVELNHLEIVNMLLEYGADVNQKNRRGMTPLMIAAQKGHFPVILSLYRHHADFNSKDRSERTALTFAREANNTTIVKGLLTIESIEVSEKELQEGIRSQNFEIAQAYQLKKMQPSITELDIELEKQKKRFEKNGQSWFDFFGNAKKAQRLNDAITRAHDTKSTQANVQTYLNTKVDGEESIMDVLASHRISFLGKTRSQEKIESVADRLSGSLTLGGS